MGEWRINKSVAAFPAFCPAQHRRAKTSRADPEFQKRVGPRGIDKAIIAFRGKRLDRENRRA